MAWTAESRQGTVLVSGSSWEFTDNQVARTPDSYNAFSFPSCPRVTIITRGQAAFLEVATQVCCSSSQCSSRIDPPVISRVAGRLLCQVSRTL